MLNFFLLGLSLGSGPCLATCGPVLLSYISGTKKNIIMSIGAYILFSLSRVSIYAILGLGVFFFGQLVSQYIFFSFSRYIFILGGIFIILTGLLVAMGKGLDYKFCRKAKGFLLKNDAKTIIIFGLLIGIMPCLPLISLLSYIGLVSKTWLDTLRYSLAFGLGTIISPLFVLVALTGLIPKIIMNNNRFYVIFNAICGLILCLLGLRLIMKAF